MPQTALTEAHRVRRLRRSAELIEMGAQIAAPSCKPLVDDTKVAGRANFDVRLSLDDRADLIIATRNPAENQLAGKTRIVQSLG